MLSMRLLTRFSTSITTTRNSLHSGHRALSVVSNVAPQFKVELLDGEHAGVALFTMSRPEARNALGRQMMVEFRQAMDAIRFDTSVRVVVLQSTVPKGNGLAVDDAFIVAMWSRTDSLYHYYYCVLLQYSAPVQT